MTEQNAEGRGNPMPLRDDRMIFLVPAEGRAQPGMSMRELWNVLWRSKLLIIGITFLFAVSTAAYALLAEQWFTAEVALVPAKRSQPLAGQLGGLAGLASIAGVNLADKGENVEALAVLRSNDFVREFIRERNLLPVLFSDKWDNAKQRWKSTSPSDQPDDRDAVRYFQRSICRVIDDKRTGLVTVSIEWKDPKVAAEWANALVERLNQQMRQRVLVESDQNIKFLREELAATNIPTLQQSLSRLLENELQTMMLARGNQEFAYRVIDRATVPKWRSRPKRTLMVCAATIGGAIVAVVFVLLLRTLQAGQPTRAD